MSDNKTPIVEHRAFRCMYVDKTEHPPNRNIIITGRYRDNSGKNEPEEAAEKAFERLSQSKNLSDNKPDTETIFCMYESTRGKQGKKYLYIGSVEKCNIHGDFVINNTKVRYLTDQDIMDILDVSEHSKDIKKLLEYDNALNNKQQL